jgi:hypothetical protein
MTSKRRTRRHAPDIELTASVQADELRFREVPETEVRFSGEPGHRSTSGTERANLPDEVDPDVTYRDVRVDYRLASEIAPSKSRGRGNRDRSPPARRTRDGGDDPGSS